jgi:hypothetical protein
MGLTKISEISLFIERTDKREDARFVAMLEFVKLLRDDSRFHGYDLKVVRQESQFFFSGDENKLKIRVCDVELDFNKKTYKNTEKRLDAYMIIKYKNGTKELVLINDFKLRNL